MVSFTEAVDVSMREVVNVSVLSWFDPVAVCTCVMDVSEVTVIVAGVKETDTVWVLDEIDVTTETDVMGTVTGGTTAVAITVVRFVLVRVEVTVDVTVVLMVT